MCLHSGPFSRTSGLYVQVPSWLSIRCLIGHLKLSRSNTELLPLPAPCSTHYLLCSLSHLGKGSAFSSGSGQKSCLFFFFFTPTVNSLEYTLTPPSEHTQNQTSPYHLHSYHFSPSYPHCHLFPEIFAVAS